MNTAGRFSPNLRQLRAFQAVYQLRKLSAAAEQLSVTQSAVSVLIRQLEEGPEDPREWEEQVHWERAGVICTACRSVVMRMLARPSEDAGPH